VTTIVGVSGSLRSGSFNAALLRVAADSMPSGARLEIASIKGIPLYDGDVETSSGLPAAVAKLKEQIDFDNQSIARNNDRFALAQEQQKTILADKSLSPTEKLLLLANINTTLVTVEQRLGQLETDRLSAQQFLSLAENVERPSVRSPAVAVKSAGPNSRTGAAVGGLIGLIIGVLVALLWDPVAARRTTA